MDSEDNPFEIFWTSIVNPLEMHWKSIEDRKEILRKVRLGNGLEIIWKFFEESTKIRMDSEGDPLEMIWKSVGYPLDIMWKSIESIDPNGIVWKSFGDQS